MLDVALSVRRPRFVVEAAFGLGEGERFGLYGPSGSGKSTILDAVAGLVALRTGRVLLDGRDLATVPLWQRRIGLLRQRPALFPHLSVGENVRYGARRAPAARLEAAAAHEAALCDRLGIAGLLDAYPGQLSGGQAQRVALARALRADAAVLLLDEPFQGLDPPLRAELVRLVREESAERSLATVLVSHELGEVQAFAERVGVLEEGRVLQVAPADELVRRPASAAVALLVGYATVVPLGRHGEQVGVHPELARLGRFPALGPVLEATLGACVPSGARWAAEVELQGRLVSLPCDRPPGRPGEVVALTLVDAPRFSGDGRLLGPPPAAGAAAPLAEPVLP